MGFVTRERIRGRRCFCVRNEATGKIIRKKGRRRCYRSARVARGVWYALDCHYTGRYCRRVPRHLRGRSVRKL